MIQYVVRRLLWILLTMVCVSMLTFGLIFFTGDPAVMLTPTRKGQAPAPEMVERVRREHGLDKPLVIQYGQYLWRLAQGDMGYSYYLRRPITEVMFEKFPNTALLAGLILLVAISVGIPLGIVAALRRNTIVDQVILVFSTIAIAVPSFILALVLIYFVSFRLKLLPFSGHGTVRHLILPVISVAAPSSAGYAIFLRTNLLNQLGADYVRTAYSKGLATRVVAYRHMLPNALIPVVTLGSIDLAYLLTGVVLVETVFGYPGIGAQVLAAVTRKDIPVVMASVFDGALLIGFGNLIADLLTAWLDPRIKLHR